MELYQLNSFVTVADTRNLTRAASLLHVSQSALSAQIRQLEDEFAVPLFHRSAKGMALTEKGRILYSYAGDVLRAAEAMGDKAREISGRTYGTCRIGLNTDGAFLRVGVLNRALATGLPDVSFVFVSSQTIRTSDMLRQGLIDLGFFFGECGDTGIDSMVLTTFRIAVVIPQSVLPHTTSLGWPQLASLPWIWSVSSCPYYQIVQEQMDRLGLEPKKVVDAMDESVVRELVLDGQGVAILREDEAFEVVRSGRCWIWGDVRFTLPLRLGWLASAEQVEPLATVVDIIGGLWSSQRGVAEESVAHPPSALETVEMF